MLSGFLKRLLFARQLQMSDGKIVVLGERDVIFPVEFMFSLLDKGFSYKEFKKLSKLQIETLAKKIGVANEGILQTMKDIFDLYGIGGLEIIDLDNKNKKCFLGLKESPIDSCFSAKSKKLTCDFTCAVLAGFFSYAFSKDVECKLLSKSLSGGYYQFGIK